MPDPYDVVLATTISGPSPRLYGSVFSFKNDETGILMSLDSQQERSNKMSTLTHSQVESLLALSETDDLTVKIQEGAPEGFKQIMADKLAERKKRSMEAAAETVMDLNERVQEAIVSTVAQLRRQRKLVAASSKRIDRLEELRKKANETLNFRELLKELGYAVPDVEEID